MHCEIVFQAIEYKVVIGWCYTESFQELENVEQRNKGSEIFDSTYDVLFFCLLSSFYVMSKVWSVIVSGVMGSADPFIPPGIARKWAVIAQYLLWAKYVMPSVYITSHYARIMKL